MKTQQADIQNKTGRTSPSRVSLAVPLSIKYESRFAHLFASPFGIELDGIVVTFGVF
jgi:hypothetical protein